MTGDEDDIASYTFDLPSELIAQRPLAERSSARLLVSSSGEGAGAGLEHRQVRDLPSLLRAGDVLVVNDTSVIPARLFGEKAGTGGRVEVLLVRPDDVPFAVTAGASSSVPPQSLRPGRHSDGDGEGVGAAASVTMGGAAARAREWICLVNASKKPKPGQRIVFGTGQTHAIDGFFATVGGAVDDEPGAFRVVFEGDPVKFAQAYGHVPLPPYIARDDDADDADRYQTVFHDETKAGSSAAPTAGLHFDDALLDAVRARGVTLARVTLHVGPGTFLPVRGDKLSEHTMHPEPWTVDAGAADAIHRARASGGRVVAVGTTSLRCLESAAALTDDGTVRAGSGLTRLFVKPGYAFRVVDALVTNFHLPGSTLFVLISAFIGRERARAAYDAAIRERYRFYSYGDACFFTRAT